MDLKHWKLFRSLDPVFASSVKWAQLIGYTFYDFHEVIEPRGGLLVRNNGDVYFVADETDDLEMMGLKNVTGYVPRVPYRMNALCGKAIKDICSGFSRAMALTEDGNVFEWGEEELFHTGSLKHKNEAMEPYAGFRSLAACKSCSTGLRRKSHRLLRTSEGDIHAWGANNYGQLGTGKRQWEAKPVKIAGLCSKMLLIACGEATSYAVDECGYVWSWGASNHSALGYLSQGDQETPKRIPTLYNIKKVCSHHLLALSDLGTIYFWGDDGRRVVVQVPDKVNIDEVEDIAALPGYGLNVCETRDHVVYFWGMWFRKYTSNPRETKFTTMDEVFASLDVPQMLKPLELECLGQDFSDMMELAFDDVSSADLKIYNNGEVIHADKGFLRRRSEYFRGMLSHEWKEKDTCNNPGFSSDAFRSFMFYLYTNRIEPPIQSADCALELIEMGDYYGEKDLIKRSGKQLCLFMGSGNALRIYDVAVKHELEDVQERVLALVSAEITDILRSKEFIEMSQVAKNHFMQKLVKEYNLVAAKRPRIK